MEAVEFNQVRSEFEEMGIQVVGTSVDPLEKLVRFRDKNELGFPLMSDADRTVGTEYDTLKSEGGSHERDTFLIASDGVIVAAYKKVQARGHAAKVLEDARRLRGEGRI